MRQDFWHLLLSPGFGGLMTLIAIIVGFGHQVQERKRARQNDENERWWQQYQQVREDLELLSPQDYVRASQALEQALPSERNKRGGLFGRCFAWWRRDVDVDGVQRVMLEVFGAAYRDRFADEDAPEVHAEEGSDDQTALVPQDDLDAGGR